MWQPRSTTSSAGRTSRRAGSTSTSPPRTSSRSPSSRPTGRPRTAGSWLRCRSTPPRSTGSSRSSGLPSPSTSAASGWRTSARSATSCAASGCQLPSIQEPFARWVSVSTELLTQAQARRRHRPGDRRRLVLADRRGRVFRPRPGARGRQSGPCPPCRRLPRLRPSSRWRAAAWLGARPFFLARTNQLVGIIDRERTRVTCLSNLSPGVRQNDLA